MGKFPPRKLVDWLEDFANQLDCPPPDVKLGKNDSSEYLKRIGAWETQQFILKKLRYAIKADRIINL